MTKRKNIQLPKEFKKYFWDVDFKKLSLKKYPEFVLGRIMNYGNVKALKWLLKLPKQLILRVAENNRELDAKTVNFWKVVYGR
jgi:hypothetical protein